MIDGHLSIPEAKSQIQTLEYLEMQQTSSLEKAAKRYNSQPYATSTMIHEEQVRQLCAIHTVNNLLQLPADLGYDSCEISESTSCIELDDTLSDSCKQPNQVIHEWSCHGRIIRRYKQSSGGGIKPRPVDISNEESVNLDDTTTNSEQNIIWKVVTKEEFDDIAKELTLREQMLMSGDESTLGLATSSRQSQATKLNNLSLMQQIRSPYGSPYFGNYSLDVIQEALKHRGVEMEFYRVSDDHEIRTIYGRNEKDTKSDNVNNYTTISKACNKHLIGFIIYEKEENQRSALSVLSRIGSHIPVVKNFCGVGQHCAITGIQYKSTPARKNDADTNKGKEDTNDSSWYIIDSKIKDIPTLDNDDELVKHLKVIQKEGALVFRAFVESSE